MGDFWLYTIGEINILIDVYNEELKRKEREKARFIFDLADIIGNRISRVLVGDKVQLITLDQAYPTLFEIDDEERRIENGRKQAQTRIAFANRYNEYLRKKHGRTDTTSPNRVDIQGQGRTGSEEEICGTE